MKQDHEKMMTDLHRLLNAQNFKDEAEVQKFMENLTANGMPSFDFEDVSDSEKAEDLVFEAHEISESNPSKAKEYIEAALTLDPDCIAAYEFLGNSEEGIFISTVFYEKGVSVGRRLFGGKYLEKNKGHFWGLHETRPYMRCLHHLAESLSAMGNVKECVAILEEMIELNPNDNQGVRDELLLYLVQLGETKKFTKYDRMFKEDSLASAHFNRALFAFSTEGQTDNANQLLSKAIKANKHVSKLLLSAKPIDIMPDGYSIGSKEEAICYAVFAKEVWVKIDGARQWLEEQTKNPKRKA
jgi:tetratricopeptide (TPR) repeat protein